MKDCIFCKITKGELPAAKIYENDDILAFLDVAPINKGHTLIIPKEHHKNISSLPADILQQIMSAAADIGRAIIKSCDYDGYNLHLSYGDCAGQVVPHVHMHLVPRVGTDGFHWNWRGLSYENGEQQDIIDKITNKLKADES